MSTRFVSHHPQPAPVLVLDQIEAARPCEGVRVVLGGPGTGKSTVAAAAAVARVAAGSTLDRTVVLANSRAAAQTLRRDITRLLDRAQTDAQVTTVHGLALGLMRRFWPHEEAPWALLRAPEQESRIRDLLAGQPVAAWPQGIRAAVGTRAFARQLRDVLARARQLNLDAEGVAEMALAAGDETFLTAARFMEEYLIVGDFSGHLDYAELIYRTRLLLAQPGVSDSVRAAFDAVIIDDAQELDPAQGALIADLARAGVPTLALGDPHQSIGWFRGASATALRDLAETTNAETLVLGTGFRLQSGVAEPLATLARRLSARDAAPAPTPAGQGGTVQVRVFDDSSAELAHVAAELREAVARDGLQWRDLAVITRAGRAQLSAAAKELVRLGVPVDVSGDEIALAEQQAVATVLLALKVAAHGGRPGHQEAQQLLASPLGGLDGVAQRQLGRALLRAHPARGTSTMLITQALAEPALLEGIDSPESHKVAALADLLNRATELLGKGSEVQVVLWELWDATDWPEALRQQALRGSRRANADLDAMVELFEAAARAGDLRGASGAATFLSDIAGQEIPADTGRELSPESRGVRVITAHRTRGLEWERVWVIGVQEGQWPRSSRSGLLLDAQRLTVDRLEPSDPLAHLRSERQLFLVACSRAKSGLSVSAVAGIDGEGGRPSRFLAELGLGVARANGRPDLLLSAASLVGDLRRAVIDETASPWLRRAAALRLADLATVTTPDGGAGFPGAHPEAWWASGDPTSASPELNGVVVITGSALEALLECPRRWFLARRVRAEGARQSKASVGDVVHLIASQAGRDGTSAEEMHRHLDTVWDRIGFETEWLSATEKVEIDAALDRFASYQEHAAGQLLAVEQEFSVPLTVAGTEVVLVGTVDRLERDAEGRLRIVDLKTTRTPLKAAEVADHAQLGVYQLAASLGAFDALAPGERRVAPPTLAFLRDGDTTPGLVSQPSIDDQPGLKGQELAVGPTWVHDKLADAVGVLRSGRFDAVECRSCRFCQFSQSCPALTGDAT